MQNQQVLQEEPVYLPGSDRSRPGMQLELQEDQPLNVQEFMIDEQAEDRDKQLYADNF